MKKDLDKIKERDEDCILIGDMNKKVGNDEYGIKNNDDDYILANNLDSCTGGPWTWIDPANKDNLSCLDLVIVSVKLAPYIKELIIDR